jgi:hypothetical protein
MADESIRVLLIEDDPEEALLIRGMLAESTEVRFRCKHAGTLSDGLARIAE